MLTDNPITRWMRGLTSEIAAQLVNLATSALGLVAALAWNDAMQSLFKEYFPATSGVAAKFVYAIIVSTFIVFVLVNFTRLASIAKQRKS
jgi:uncharacterized protein DUF5654